jgi:hypothetical protein
LRLAPSSLFHFESPTLNSETGVDVAAPSENSSLF